MFSDLFWALYWIDVFSSFGPNMVGSLVVAVTAFGAIGGLRLAYITSPKMDNQAAMKFAFVPAAWWALLVFFFLFSLNFIPTKQTMYMMLGVKTTENVVESPLGKKLQQIIDAEVDGYLKNISPKKD
jgi:hypothetical protein